MTRLAQNLITLATEKSAMLVSAESCTGGMIAVALTDIAGSSVVFGRGFVTYSNTAKSELLDVNPQIITEHGAVSSQVAEAMAEGAIRCTSQPPNIIHSIAVSVSGIAGPDGGTPAKPVGTVWFGIAHRTDDKTTVQSQSEMMLFDGSRHDIRTRATDHALGMIMELLKTL